MFDYRSTGFKERGLIEIPTQFIEPYLVAMLSMELEGIEFHPTEERLEEAKNNLKGVERFINRFGELKVRLAITNVYENFYRMTLDEAKEIIKASWKERFDKVS